MAINLDTLRAELQTGHNGSDITWRDIAGFLKLKMFEAQVNGGVTSYTINGRTVARASLADLSTAYRDALHNAAIEEHGGITGCPITFRGGNQ